jgi:hypothetical protein
MEYLFVCNILIEKEGNIYNYKEKQFKNINVVDDNKYGENVIKCIKNSINPDETFIELDTIKFEGNLIFNKVK